MLNIVREALKQFGIAGSLRRVATGLDSTHRVKTVDGQVFALRVSGGIPIRNVSAFRVEAEWVDALSDNGWFRVPQVQRAEDGALIGQVIDDNGVVRASTLLTWLPGRRWFRPTENHARALGQMAGALHQHAKTSMAPKANSIKAWDAKLMCLMPDDPADGLYHIDPRAAKRVQTIYCLLDRIVTTLDSSEIGLINADLGLHNVLWHKGKASLVDFNDSGIGPYAYCLARLVGRMRRYENGAALVKELLDGYRDVAPLPDAYLRWGDLFELAADVFKLNYGAQRAVRRGLPLRESELAILKTLELKLASVRTWTA